MSIAVRFVLFGLLGAHAFRVKKKAKLFQTLGLDENISMASEGSSQNSTGISIAEIIGEPGWDDKKNYIAHGNRGTVFHVAGNPGVVLKHASKINAESGTLKWESVKNDVEREWSVLARLRNYKEHPCIVTGYEKSDLGDDYFILMQKVGGGPAANMSTHPSTLLHLTFSFLETINWLWQNGVITHDKVAYNFLPLANYACLSFIDMDCDIDYASNTAGQSSGSINEQTLTWPKHKSALDSCFESVSPIRKLRKLYPDTTAVGKALAGLAIGTYAWNKESRIPNYLYKTEEELAYAYHLLRTAWLLIVPEDPQQQMADPAYTTFGKFDSSLYKNWVALEKKAPVPKPLLRGNYATSEKYNAAVKARKDDQEYRKGPNIWPFNGNFPRDLFWSNLNSMMAL